MNKVDKGFSKIISYCLVSFIGIMLALTILNIILRWFGINFMWIDPLVRHLVFSCAFLGGALATGQRNHIKIDILNTLYSKKYPNLFFKLDLALGVISSIVCFFMAYAGYQFFSVEANYGKSVFWGIHSSFLVAIIPVGFLLIGFRFLTSLFVEKESLGNS